MAENTPATPDEAAPTTGEATATDAAPTFEGEFNAERAAALVANVRTENKALKDRLRSFEEAKKAAAEAEMTESQKAIARAETAERELAEIRTDRLRDTVARAHNLPADLAAFLTGDTEEAMNAKAEALAKFATTPPPAADLPGKPKPNLVPGHAGTPAAPDFDPTAVARAARRY